MQPRKVKTMWENLDFGVALQNCAYLWKNPGYAPVVITLFICLVRVIYFLTSFTHFCPDLFNK